MTNHNKVFGLWSAIFLGIGSMVGAGIFIVIGEAGAIAGKGVLFSFLIGGAIALLCGYSLAKLAIRYPSRGGLIEYLVQIYGEGFFSGSMGILFYLAQLVALAAVAKSFGTYATTYLMPGNPSLSTTDINLFASGIILFFTLINLLGAAIVAKAENFIVIFKLSALILFTLAALLYIHPQNLMPDTHTHLVNIFYALGLTFFAFQGFSVITNSVEDMQAPEKTMLKSIILAILLVATLYLAVSIAVLGNLSLPEIIKAQDFALAEAAKPAFGEWGFKIIAATALVATASAINATLYAVTQISYTLAKEGNLPEVYQYNIFKNTEGLILSCLLILPMIWFLALDEIASIAAIMVLLIQGIIHLGHLLKLKETGAKAFWVSLAAIGSFIAAAFAIDYTSQKIPHFALWILSALAAAYLFEVLLRLFTHRTIEPQMPELTKLEKALVKNWQQRKMQLQNLIQQRIDHRQ